jgi:hypothetical protein
VLDWIASFVNRWAPSAGQAVADLVHWAVHALASVVYFVFGQVGKAWSAMWGAYGWQLTAAWQLVQSVIHLGERILKIYFPGVYKWIATEWASLRGTALAWYHDALRAVDVARTELAHLIDVARQWVLRDIWAPLVRTADQLRADLLKWGYTAWYYITHPDKLAALILVPLIAAAEASVWVIGPPVLKFATVLVLRNVRRVLVLAEDVFTSVF